MAGPHGPAFSRPGQYPGYPPYPTRPSSTCTSMRRGVSGAGLASSIRGILSFFIPWLGLLSLAAVVLGFWGRGSTRVGRGQSGEGFAIAGLILGFTLFFVHLVLFRGLMFFWLFR